MTAQDILDAAKATTVENKKKWARRLVRDHGFTQAEALDTIAQNEGFGNWSLLANNRGADR